MTTLRAAPPPPSERASLERGRILLVDDDHAVRHAYARVLRGADFTVEQAETACDAIEKVTSNRFDVALLDLHLPDTSGLELIRMIRMLDADLPVVLMTGAADLPTAIEAVEVGALRYLRKPVPSDVLRTAVADGVRVRSRARLERQAFQVYAVHLKEQKARHERDERLERAIDSIEMAYQPIVRVSDHKIVAYEALVRPREELTSPALLFETAEALHRLPDVGRKIRAAVAQAMASHRDTEVFVNLHPHDLLDDHLLSKASPLSAHASRVTLELTECASLQDITAVRERIDALRSLGFRIAIDDLGAGYAGLGAVVALQPDVVKLDMSFTKGVSTDVTKQKLVCALRQLCSDLGTMFVTEGVESLAELEALCDLGCDVFQGYLFAKPGPAFPHVRWADERPSGITNTLRDSSEWEIGAVATTRSAHGGDSSPLARRRSH